MVSAALASRVVPNPAASTPALAAVRHCRRVSVISVMAHPPACAALFLVLLHAEFLNARGNVIRRVLDYGAQFLRRRRDRDLPAIFDQTVVVRLGNDRHNL